MSRTPRIARLPAPAICGAMTSRARPSASSGLPRELEPAWLAFVGKEAYRGAFRQRGPSSAPRDRSARRDQALRPSVHLARKRRGPLQPAAPLVPGAGRPRERPTRAHRSPGAPHQRDRSRSALPLRQRLRLLVDHAGVGGHPARTTQTNAATRASRGVRPARFRGRPARRRVVPIWGTGSSGFGSGVSGCTSCACRRSSQLPSSTCAMKAASRSGGSAWTKIGI